MTIDERIEALTQSVVLMAGMHRDLESKHEEHERKFEQHREQMTRILERLVAIAENHERRLDNLEGGR